MQLVVVPILRKNCDVTAVTSAAAGLAEAANAAGIRTRLDDDEEKSPGFRFNFWEMKARSGFLMYLYFNS